MVMQARTVAGALSLGVVLLACGGIPASPDAAFDDAGSPDASTPDASTPDAGTPDAGTPDASTPDAGTPDAGTPDAGTPDAGTPDAGEPDAGEPDAGEPDAGIDAGPAEAGTPDAGAADAGLPMNLWTCCDSRGGELPGAHVQAPLGTPPRRLNSLATRGWAMAVASDESFVAVIAGPNFPATTLSLIPMDGGAEQLLPLSHGGLWDLTISPDDAWLAAREGSTWDAGIIVLPLDGGAPLQAGLRGSPYDVYSWSFSPSGRYLASTGSWGPTEQLTVFDTQTATLHALAPPETPPPWLLHYDWLPTDELLVAGASAAAPAMLQRCSPQGVCTPLGNSPASVTRSVDVASDGTFAILAVDTGLSGELELLRFPLDGGASASLLRAPHGFFPCVLFSISPDLQRFATCTRAGSLNRVIVISTSAPTPPTPVVDLPGLEHGQWLPDSRHLSFLTSTPGGPFELRRVDTLAPAIQVPYLLQPAAGGLVLQHQWTWARPTP